MSSQISNEPAPVFIERRLLPRLTVAAQLARIAWKERPFHMGKAPAHLVDITAWRACLLTQRPAELGQPLCVGVESHPWEWVKATIREATPDGSLWRYHLAFSEPCPVGLLETIVATALSARGIWLPENSPVYE